MRNRGSERLAGFPQGHTVNRDHAPGCVHGAFHGILSQLLTISSWFQVSFLFPGLDAPWGSAWPRQSLYPQRPDVYSDWVDCEGSAVKLLSPDSGPTAQQGQSSTGRAVTRWRALQVTRLVQRQDPNPPWERRPGSQGAAGEIPSPLIRQRNWWPAELAVLSRDWWALLWAPRAAWEAGPVGVAQMASPNDKVNSNMSWRHCQPAAYLSCHSGLVEQGPHPPTPSSSLPVWGLFTGNWFLVGLGGKHGDSISTTDVGRFPSCLEVTNNNKSKYLALMKCWPLFWALYPNRFSTHDSPKGHAAAAKSLQSCPTLCDPRGGAHQAPPSLGFSGQEHWSGLPFSNAWKWSRVWLLATPWTAAYQASPSMGFSRQEYY